MIGTETSSRRARAEDPTDAAGWLALDRQYRIPGRYEVSLVLTRGNGVRVWDADGKEYLDFESGQVCVSTGHCHPAYTQAIIDQARTLVQTGSGYTNPARVKLARKLAEIMPGDLECSYFACTGSEATEVALRLAKLYTGRSEIVSLVRGYHGMTHGSLSVSGLGGKFKAVPGSGLPGTIFIPAPYAYRSATGDDMEFFRQGLEIINWMDLHWYPGRDHPRGGDERGRDDRPVQGLCPGRAPVV